MLSAFIALTVNCKSETLLLPAPTQLASSKVINQDIPQSSTLLTHIRLTATTTTPAPPPCAYCANPTAGTSYPSCSSGPASGTTNNSTTIDLHISSVPPNNSRDELPFFLLFRRLTQLLQQRSSNSASYYKHRSSSYELLLQVLPLLQLPLFSLPALCTPIMQDLLRSTVYSSILLLVNFLFL